jgi:hypothetical protein
VVSEDESAIDKTEVPAAWPTHIAKAVELLNNRILPSLKYSPREIMLGMLLQPRPMPILAAAADKGRLPSNEEHVALAEILRSDANGSAEDHAVVRKAAFDKGIRQPTSFKPGSLVQVYDSKLDGSHETSAKLAPRWSAPRQVVKQVTGSYTLQTLEGKTIPKAIHANRLRLYVAPKDSLIAKMFRGEIIA